MFGFFKKKMHYNENIKNIFLKICSSLPKRYSYLYSQIEDGIIYDFKKEKEGFNKVICHTDLLNKYDDKNGAYFAINKIILKDKETSRQSSLTIEVGYGCIIRFEAEYEELLKTDYKNIDVDISNIEIKVFEDIDIKKLFSK